MAPDSSQPPGGRASTRLWTRGLAVGLLAALGALLILNNRVNRALDAAPAATRPVEFVAAPERSPLPFWSGEEVAALAAAPGGLYAAGAFGVARLEVRPGVQDARLGRADISLPLPTRHATALSAWRTDLVAGLEFEGLFLYRDGAWSEMRSGFGALHVRALIETPAGELWVGAREGLFRMGFSERAIERLHSSPVRSVALSEGGLVLSGGEKGLFATQSGLTRSMRLEGSDASWVDQVAVFDRRVYAVTPTGLFGEGPDAVLRPIPGGAEVASIAVQGDRLFAAADPPDAAVRRFDGTGRLEVEQLPFALRRVFVAGDRLLADTASGLAERSNERWQVISKRRQSGNLGGAHVGALASFHGRVVVGFFDGGLAELASDPDQSVGPLSGATAAPAMILRSLTDPLSPSIWAVNALLDAGGVLHVASLRGAFRFDGSRFTAVEGVGAAFALARTSAGVAIGYGEGVLLPDRKLLSAFHGLPGNQATALAALDGGLLVGTPSGLGYVEDRKVRWRVASGEGKLPHPWVTAILPLDGSVLIGTYGGGVTRRSGALSGAGEWKPVAETAGLKVNTGCLVRASANGRVYAGTDGNGLLRLSLDGTRFEPLKLSLPSPRVTALFEKDGFLYIGTDEGLTRWPLGGDGKP